jgi:hypothetical protein
MKKIPTYLLLFIFTVKLSAQKFDNFMVTKEMLLEKFHPIDTAAEGCVLSKKMITSFDYITGWGFQINTEAEIYIKIYKKSGLDLANYEIDLQPYKGNTPPDNVRFIKCITYNMTGNIITETPLTKEGIFENKVNEYLNQAKITMPNVKVGSVLKIKYVLNSFNIVRLPTFEFQDKIPTNVAEYFTDYPEFFIYKPITKGFSNINTTGKLVDGSESISKCSNAFSLKLKYVQCKFSLQNIPALKEEPFVDNPENYRISVVNELERTRFPDEPVKDYTTTWEGVAKSIFEDSRFGNELKKTDYFQDDLKPLLVGTTTDIEKVTKIFNFVKNKMAWNEEYGIFSEKGVRKAYNSNIGEVADINFILIAMLKSAGLEANPVLSATIKSGITYNPSRTVFNYVLASCKIGDETILMDATRKNAVLNYLPTKLLNWTGRLIKKNGDSEEIDLMPKNKSIKTKAFLINISDKNEITGKARITSNGYHAMSILEHKSSKNKENRIDFLEKKYENLEISNFKFENLMPESFSIKEEFDFEYKNGIEIINNKILFNPLFFLAESINPFNQTERQMPIYFGFPTQSKIVINITIPENRKIIEIPKPLSIKTVNGEMSYVCNIIQNENNIQISLTLENNFPVYIKDFYPDISKFYASIQEQESKQIVLEF